MTYPADATHLIAAYGRGRRYQPPRAIHLMTTWHVGEASRDIEISAFKTRMERGEIERIAVTDLQSGGVTVIHAYEVAGPAPKKAHRR